ncbi:uncharacterized protein LOC132748786 isoform X1 [Ruditapes philippinarum]|uniref:uncharacterized protein LOC132748786 isoform X1 n=1 Tax=Ruditapes philippinarum TaxID=129788 RepID=UPI00295B4F3B|nr:uncharacterized protein LOC132748786 isoform X1 [Ruditapes philippinarum]
MTIDKFLLICSLSVFLYAGFTCGSKKKGVVAWATGLLCDDFKNLNNIAWWYDYKNDLTTYHQTVTQACPHSFHYMPEFIPLIWKSRWNGAIHMNISSNASYVMVLNEPDQAVQTNMSAQQVADLWPEIEKHSHEKPILSPAPAHHNFQWLDEFFRVCNGCRIDYVAAHAYSCNANHIMSYLEKLYHRYNKEIWLTEFACPKSTDEHQQLHLMKTLLPKLEAAPYVLRYSWFMARVKRIFDGGFITPAASLLHNDSSTLTMIGHYYNNFNGTGHSSQIVG